MDNCKTIRKTDLHNDTVALIELSEIEPNGYAVEKIGIALSKFNRLMPIGAIREVERLIYESEKNGYSHLAFE